MRTCVLVHVCFARRETKNPKIFLLVIVSRFFFSALNLFMSMFPSADCKFKINFSTSEYFIVARGRKHALIAFSADFITHKASHEQSLKALANYWQLYRINCSSFEKRNERDYSSSVS